MALSYAFGGNTGQSYEELQRRRLFAEAMMQRGMSSQPKTAIEGINAAASSIMGALLQRKIGAQDAANREKATQAALSIFGRPAPDVVPPNPGISTPRNPNDPVQIGNDTMAALGKTPNGWDGIKAGIFAGESGGDYNALFGFQNRPGGAFSNVQLTNMSVDDALKFADPNGPYGQHVKGQIGRVATPLGAYQVVGTTLAAAKKGLGLRGDEVMTPALQDRIGQWIYQNQGTGAWEGYKGPQQPQGGMDPEILTAMSDPNLSPEMKSALSMLLQQRIAAAQPPDPMAALELEKTKLEVDKLKNPAPPESVTTRLMLAKQAGLQPGTPEYSTYMATGELPKPQEPAKPIEINNKLVDPTTGKVIGDYGTPDPGFRMLTPEEAAAMRLPQGAYQVGPDNKVSQIGGGGTSVTVNNGSEVGTIPQGYELFTDPATGARSLRALSGGPEDKSAAAATKVGNNQTLTDTIIGAANKARTAASNRQLGGFGQGVVAKLNSYSDSAEVQRQVDVLKANATVETLSAMRAASPTGGALGAVSDSENAMLAAKAGALDPSSPNFARDLDDYELTLLKIVHGPEAGQKIFEQTRGGKAYTPGAPTDGLTAEERAYLGLQ